MANANRQFQVTDPATLQALVRTQPLATLVIAHEGALHANHIPLFLDPHQGPHGTLLGHVARANGVWPLLPQQAVAVFHGPQAYISPSWYPSKAVDGKQVPTWNYAAVHAHGTLRVLDGEGPLRDMLHRLSDAQEAHRPHPWRVDDAPPDYLEKMQRAIVGVALEVQRWEGLWKVSQNRTDEDRAGVVQGLLGEGTPAAEDMAALVQGRLMG